MCVTFDLLCVRIALLGVRPTLCGVQSSLFGMGLVLFDNSPGLSGVSLVCGVTLGSGFLPALNSLGAKTVLVCSSCTRFFLTTQAFVCSGDSELALQLGPAVAGLVA